MSEQPWLVLGHYGGHNTGDEAMLTGLVQGCPPAVQQRLLVVARQGAAALPPNLHHIAAIPATSGAVLPALRQCHGLILGGGSHFQDDYADQRYMRHLRYMARFVVLSAVARRMGKPVLWLGMGFGPCFRRSTRMITRLGLQFAAHVTVREAASYNEIKGWIAADRLTHSFDLAALMLDAVAPAPPAAARSPVLGVSLLSVQNTLTGGAGVDQHFSQQVGAALEAVLASQPQLRIRIFVIRGGSREDDFDVSAQLYRRLVAVDAARVAIIPHLPDPTLTLRKMQECQSMLATRFHAGVLGYLAGCRLACVVYHRKLTDLADEIGLPRAACIPLDEQATAVTLEPQIRALVGGAPEYQPHLPLATALARARLNSDLIQRYT